MQEAFIEKKTKINFYKTFLLDFPPHLHDDIELIYVNKGNCDAYCDGTKYTLTEGTFFLVFPNQVHYYEKCTMDNEYIVLITKPSRLLNYTDVFSSGAPSTAVYTQKNDFENLSATLELALKEYSRYGDSEIVSAYLTAFFGILLKHYRIEKSKQTSDCVSNILKYCNANYRNNISIDDISKELYISRSHISHIFSSKLNMNFCDYINSLRLNYAVKLLNDTSYSITNISDMSGFSTIRTFNRAFLKQRGITPSEYRKTLKDK